MLGVLDTFDESVDTRVAEAGVDDDRTDLAACWFQQHQAALGHVHHVLHRGFVVRVLTEVAELGQREVITEFDVFH